MKASVTMVAILALLGLAVAGCGGGDGGTAATGGGGDTSKVVALAQKEVAAARQGTYSKPPASGPVAEPGKDVWVISCGQSAPGCSTIAEGAMEAGDALGWNVKLYDGKLTPTGWADGFRKAIAAGAEGIIPVVLDCPLIKGGLEEAKAAGIPVVGMFAFDCNDPSYAEKGEPLYTAVAGAGESIDDFFGGLGRAKANYAIAEEEGSFQAIVIKAPEYQALTVEEEAFAEAAAKCEGCEIIETLPIPATQLASGKAAQRVATALSKNPDASVLYVPYDAMTLVLAQALAKDKDLLVLGSEGFELDLIDEGVQDLAVPYNGNWAGWAAADTLNRLFAGETKLPDEGLGWQLIDASNLPASGSPEAPIDYKPIYEEVWGGR